VSQQERMFTALLDHLSFHSTIPYWIKWGHFSKHSATLVDWLLLNKALFPYPPTYKMWASKFALGHSVVGLTMAQWKNGNPLSAPSVSSWMSLPFMSSNVYIPSLCSWLQDADTSPSITHCFVTSLHQWGITLFSISPCSPAMATASHQTKTGFFQYPSWVPLPSMGISPSTVLVHHQQLLLSPTLGQAPLLTTSSHDALHVAHQEPTTPGLQP